MPAKCSKKKSKAAHKCKLAVARLAALDPGPNTLTGDMWQCRYCTLPFHSRGLAMHEKKCEQVVAQAIGDLQHDLSQAKHQGLSTSIFHQSPLPSTDCCGSQVPQSPLLALTLLSTQTMAPPLWRKMRAWTRWMQMMGLSLAMVSATIDSFIHFIVNDVDSAFICLYVAHVNLRITPRSPYPTLAALCPLPHVTHAILK